MKVRCVNIICHSCMYCGNVEGQASGSMEVTDSIAVRRNRREKKKKGASALEKIK